LTLSKAHEQSVVKAVLSDDRDVKVAKQEILKEVTDELELPKTPSREESTKTSATVGTSLPNLDTEATRDTDAEESPKKEDKDGRWDGLYDR